MFYRLFTSRKIFVCLLAMGVTALLGACGGGGGDSGPSYPNMNYTGVSTAATIDESNAADFPFVVIEGSSGADNLPLPIAASIDAEFADKIPDPDNIKKASIVITDLIKNNLSGGTNQVTGVTQSYTGTCGGKGSITENATDTSVSGSIVFDNYCEGDIDTYGFEFRMHGKITYSATFHYDGSGFLVLDTMSINFQYLKMTFNDGITTVSEEFSASVDVTSFDAANNPVDFTMSVNFKYQGQIFKIANLQVDDLAGTISGRLYHPEHGYVEVETTTPFIYMINDPDDETDDQFCNGSLFITGVDTVGNTATISFTDPGTYCTTYNICIDVNGTVQCSDNNPWGVAPDPLSWYTPTPTTPVVP